MSDHKPDTDQIDYDRLGKSVAEHLHAACPMGWTREDAETLREFAASLRSAKATAWTTLIGILVVGAIGLLVRGFLQWSKAQ